MPDIKAIQSALRDEGLDGWLFYDHHRRDPIANRILGLSSNGLATRRWFYFIPSRGEPRKLVHRIEARMLDSVPGRKTEYSSWEELHKGLRKLLGGAKNVAMQYSPQNNIPYIGLVDAGTIELVRKLGAKVQSSADLVQLFEAAWSPGQLESHLEAGKIIDRIVQVAFARAGAIIREGKSLTEFELKEWIRGKFKDNSLESEDGPVVAVPPNNGNPHYEPTQENCKPIRKGDLLLLDVWAKFNRPGSVYYDITWMGYLGEKVPEKYAKIFAAVKKARDSAVHFVQLSVAAKRRVHGWEVDHAARSVIEKAHYGKYFVHRTGHSIGQEVHGNGANMDGLETRDDRFLVPHTCFSVEPGIYLPDFGVRSEVNVYVGDGQAYTTGAVQQEIIPILT
jgi:Xaa-Pro dipeptidase